MKDLILTGEAILFGLAFLIVGLIAALFYADVSEKEKED